MCGMDETTLTYLSADLARQLGKYDEALRMIARVLTSREVNERIKAKAREMKDQIIKLLDEWKEKQPQELIKAEKKADKEH